MHHEHVEVSPQELERHQEIWAAFLRLSKYVGGGVALILIGMAIFLL